MLPFCTCFAPSAHISTFGSHSIPIVAEFARCKAVLITT